MRHAQFAILLTFVISIASIASIVHAQGLETKLKDFKGPKVVEFQMVHSLGADGYPQFNTSDPRGPIGDAVMSVRCEEGYHWEEIKGKRVPYAWNYHELFVIDSEGPSNKRQDAAARGQLERGYHFKFKPSDCSKAPANMTAGSRCVIKAELAAKAEINKKTGASVPSHSAKIIEWTCQDPKPGTEGSGGTNEMPRRTSP